MPKTLYEDSWCQITPDELSIKCYYFPIGTSKSIKLSRITAVYYIEQEFYAQLGKVKGWGMSFSPIWWACDIRRNWHSSSGPTHFNVVIDCDESTYKGFTVINIKEFIDVLRSVTPPHTVYCHGMPF